MERKNDFIITQEKMADFVSNLSADEMLALVYATSDRLVETLRQSEELLGADKELAGQCKEQIARVRSGRDSFLRTIRDFTDGES